MSKKLIIYSAIIIFVLGVLAVFLLQKCTQYYDPVSKKPGGDCYSVWQKEFWGSYGNKGVSGKQAERIAAEAIKKSDRIDNPIVIGAAKFKDGAWWVFIEADSSRIDIEAGRNYWVSIDAKEGKVLKIISLEFSYLGEEVVLDLDKGVFFERGELLVAVESISKVIMEDPFDEVYNVKLAMADAEEFLKVELWLSSTGASEKGKDKLSWKGYSIQVTAADENVPFAKLAVNKLEN